MASALPQGGQIIVEQLLLPAFQWVASTTGRQITYAKECEESVEELRGKQQSSSWVETEAQKATSNGEDVDLSEVQKLKKREEQIIAEAKKVVSEFDKGITCCGRLPNVWKRYRIGKKAKKCIQQIEKLCTDNRSKIIGVDILPGEVTADPWLISDKPKACELQSRTAVMDKIIRILGDDRTQLVGLWGPAGAGRSMLIKQVLHRISFPGLKTLSLTGLRSAANILYQNIPPAELSNLHSLNVEGFEEASLLTNILCYSPKTEPHQDSAPGKRTLGFNCLKAPVDHDSQIQSPPNLSTSGMTNEKGKRHIALQSETLCPERHLQGNSRHENLRCLTVCGSETLKFLFTTSTAQALPHLTTLTIADCNMMEEVIQVDNKDNDIKFQELTTLCLQSLENLTTFSQGNISISFPSLKSLNISDCHKLTALFTDSKDGETEEEISCSLFHAKVSPSFPSLDNLDIRNMNNMTRIWQCQVYKHAISSKHGGEPGGSSSEGSTFKLLEAFLHIKKLHITDCGSLVKVLDVEGSSEVENNENCLDAQLNEVELKNLMKIEDIWGRNGPNGRRIGYRYLETASLCRCRRIESLFPASMAYDLLRLQSLKVQSCDGMKHLIGEENPSSKRNAPLFFFPAVKILELQELPRLMTFYCGPHYSEWPSLERLMVSKCGNFIIFGSEYKEFKASNQTSLDSQPLFLINKHSFCRLSTLKLSQNQLMKEIWRGSSPMKPSRELSSVKLFPKLKVLKIISSSKEPIILPNKFLDESPRLESLRLHHVPIKISKTPESEGSSRQLVEQFVTKRSLRKVKLNTIPDMTVLTEGLDSLLGTSSYSFECLTSLKVSNCPCLAYLFTYSTVESLGCLTTLTIENCEGMKVVVASEGEKKDKVVVGSELGNMTRKVSLCKLECLTLDSLQALTSFCEENYEFNFPLLQEVTIRECSQMKRFTQGKASSPNLIKVEFKGIKIDLPHQRNINRIIDKVDVEELIRRMRDHTKKH